MKILILQLARFGDILQTWPTLRAIRRNYPDAEIDLVVRSKFKEAAIHCESVNRIIEFDTRALLAPSFSDNPSEVVMQDTLDQLDMFLSQTEPYYDQIINLSYSPMSSYLNYLLADQTEDLRGYSRFSDGYLSLTDQASSYFYAQVGPGRTSRLHLTDVFAATAGLILEKNDFQPPSFVNESSPESFNSLVIHVGASDPNKNLSRDKWSEIIHQLAGHWEGQIYLVGTASESLQDFNHFPSHVIDMCGRTDFKDLFQLVRNSRGLIACDSMMIQIANLCQVPTLNFSHTSVSFCETGPRIMGSRILKFQNSERIDATEVICVLNEMINGTYLFKNTYCLVDSYDHEAIVGPFKEKDNFQWELTKALYFESSFPVIDIMSRYKAMAKIQELAGLGMEQVAAIRKKQNSEVAANILNYIDDLMESIAKIEKSVSPVVRWFNTEKLRIGPGEMDAIINQTEILFETLQRICSHYVRAEKRIKRPQGDIDNGNTAV